MSYLKDAAIDIINAAKISKDSEFKIFQLGQIREIVVHRQKDLLPSLVNDIFSFMTERNANVRKFLVKFSTDLFNQDPVVVFPKMLDLYGLFLSDSNDGVLCAVVKEMSKLYPKIVLYISSMSEANSQEAIFYYNSVKSIVTKFHEYLISARSDLLKHWCIKFIEEQILFATPSSTTSVDPRIARKDPRLSRTTMKDASTTGSNINTAEVISLHHAIVSRTALQKDAEETIQKFSSWILKGGPANYPLSPNLHATIAQTLASVGTVRPAYGLTAAKLLTQFLIEKSSLVLQIDGSYLENMARAAMRLLRAASLFTSDSEGQMHKLKAAINSLDLKITGESEILAIGRKRDISEVADDEGLEDEAYRTSVIDAVDMAEALRKQQQARAAAAAESLFQGGSNINIVDSKVGIDEHTELSADILSIETSAFRFVTVLMSIQQEPSPHGDFINCYPLPPSDGRGFNDLSIFSLLKLFENYFPMLITGDVIMNQYKDLLTRTVISMVISSIGNESYTNVKIVSSWSSSLNKADYDGIPVNVSVPRALWLFVSFALQTCGSETMDIDLERDISERVEMLVTLCNELCDCCEYNWDNEENHAALCGVHEGIVLAIMCRMLQIPHLRDYCGRDFLLKLHSIPLICVRLLKLLVSTGTEGSSTKETRYRGTKGDALSLTAQLVAFAEDIDIATECLHFLLWNTLNDNFEARSRTIDVIVHEILKQNDWCNDRIFSFAIQSLVTSFGLDQVLSYNSAQQSSLDGSEVVVRIGSIYESLSLPSFDHGLSFGGNFETFFNQDVTMDFTKASHFFNKLCLEEISLLPVFMELGASITGAPKEYSDTRLAHLKSALKDIIPAIHHTHSVTEIFKLIGIRDKNARPLIAFTLSLLQHDFSKPAESNLIEMVLQYLGIPDSSDSTSWSNIMLIDNDEDFSLLLPIISGLSRDTVERCLPRIIHFYGDDSDGLETIFTRIIKARPPPLSKTDLFVALHRINIDQHDLKTKSLIQAIAICLKNQTEFNGTVIRDSLLTLMKDEIPHVVLMRTALLSANSFPEIKKLVLEKLIPLLVGKAVWSSAPKVWEGVMVGADNLTAGAVSKATCEPTIKSLLGIPGNILKSVLKVTKNLKRILAKYLQSLSSLEREEVLSGKSLSYNDGSSAAPLELPQDNDKKKIVKELLSLNPEALGIGK